MTLMQNPSDVIAYSKKLKDASKNCKTTSLEVITIQDPDVVKEREKTLASEMLAL